MIEKYLLEHSTSPYLQDGSTSREIIGLFDTEEDAKDFADWQRTYLENASSVAWEPAKTDWTCSGYYVTRSHHIEGEPFIKEFVIRKVNYYPANKKKRSRR